MKICSDCKGSGTNGIERGHGPCDSCRRPTNMTFYEKRAELKDELKDELNK